MVLASPVALGRAPKLPGRLAGLFLVLTVVTGCGGDEAPAAGAEATTVTATDADAADSATGDAAAPSDEGAASAVAGKPGPEVCESIGTDVVAGVVSTDVTLQNASDRDDLTACTFVGADGTSTYVVQFATDFHGTAEEQFEAFEDLDPEFPRDQYPQLGEGAWGQRWGSTYQIIGPSPVSMSMAVTAPEDAVAVALFEATATHLG